MPNYVSPTWVDNSEPKLNAANLQALTDCVANNQLLHGSGEPTTSTAGAIGQRYRDDTTGIVYVCKSESSGTYTWESETDHDGFTDEIKQALLQLAAKVAYIDADGQDYYDDLYDALYNTTWAITNTLTNCTTSNGISSIHKGDAYSATITASSGYTLTGATVSITMGGTDITSTAYSNGVISIAAVTGALVITISAALDFPADYQKVEYLQSSGSEYIDTGIYGDQTTSLELNMQRITPITTVARVFGARTGIASNGFFLSTLANGKVYIDAGASTSGTQQTAQCTWTLTKVDIEIDDTGYSYDGTAYSWASDHHGQPFTTPDTLLIFNGYSGGSTSTGVEAKLYGITVKKNGVAVFNGIPCYRKSDNEPGLYDTVTGAFFDNDSGSGAFTVGGDI